VLDQLACADLIDELPLGLQSPVGEGGGSLSVGQRQLVCFARALLVDPAILILDEATSSIDSATEARLQTSLQALVRGRTTLVVAHRLSTIRSASQVLVLDHGRIVERGRHADLIRQDGPYSRLAAAFSRPAG
jgi:ATP-binding cassette subfamily B protein